MKKKRLGKELPGNSGITIHLKRKNVLTEALAYEILSVVEEITPGKVATYGQIARLIGRERNARLVGRVLSSADRFGDFPCHRVVASDGRTAPGWKEQETLLKEEGVPFLKSGRVDLSRCRFDC